MQVDGICCHVECSGEGQGVVLLHGWGQNCSMMRLVQRELEDRYRVVNLDLPGFGDSVPLKKPMSIFGPSLRTLRMSQRSSIAKIIA